MKSFTEESPTMKTEVHHLDFQSLLTSTQVWNLLNSPMNEEYEERFENVNDDPEKDFVHLRDYLITMVLLLQSAQHPAAVSNLTVNELNAGEWDETTDVKQYVTVTKHHKTAGICFLIVNMFACLPLRLKTNGCRVRVMFDVKFTIASYGCFSLNNGAIIKPTNVYNDEFILDAVM